MTVSIVSTEDIIKEWHVSPVTEKDDFRFMQLVIEGKCPSCLRETGGCCDANQDCIRAEYLIKPDDVNNIVVAFHESENMAHIRNMTLGTSHAPLLYHCCKEDFISLTKALKTAHILQTDGTVEWN